MGHDFIQVKLLLTVGRLMSVFVVVTDSKTSAIYSLSSDNHQRTSVTADDALIIVTSRAAQKPRSETELNKRFVG